MLHDSSGNLLYLQNTKIRWKERRIFIIVIRIWGIESFWINYVIFISYWLNISFSTNIYFFKVLKRELTFLFLFQVNLLIIFKFWGAFPHLAILWCIINRIVKCNHRSFYLLKILLETNHTIQVNWKADFGKPTRFRLNSNISS